MGSFLSCFSTSGDAPSNTAQASANDTKAPEKKKAKTVGGGANNQTDKTSSGSGYNNYNYNQQATGVPAAAAPAPAANTGLSVRDYVLFYSQWNINLSISFLWSNQRFKLYKVIVRQVIYCFHYQFVSIYS